LAVSPFGLACPERREPDDVLADPDDALAEPDDALAAPDAVLAAPDDTFPSGEDFRDRDLEAVRVLELPAATPPPDVPGSASTSEATAAVRPASSIRTSCFWPT
jgi:hypothetical protein